MGGNEVVVESGTVVVLRHFDIAYSIDLARAEGLCAAHSSAASRRGRLGSVPEKALAFGVPPVQLPLAPLALDIGGCSRDVGVTARLYDFGVVVLAVRVPVAHCAWSDFVALAQAADQAIGPAARSRFWEERLDEVRAVIAPALLRPSEVTLEEDYLLAVVHAFGEPLTATALLDRVDLVPLLSGETRRLSESARRDLLRQSHSYYEDDLVVLTWDRAFIYEPRGDSDVADVLEVANAQLLELRYYDELLDAELPRMYDLVEEARGAASLRAARRFAHLARRLYTLVAEVTELTEKVDNALQVTEDVYLARIYASALDLFRVPKLGAAVDRKLAIVRDTYTALYDEASSRRAELLEIAIVLLIVIEVVLALVRH
ncbi:hypothetical protein [Dokdonella ginsengisoli]|uniref:DUF155 domain-containing protein n=1 Tax=Dokdonella ginsengisoli TaxID=363846 RepID=A0ABV9QZI4_9GAMM